MCFFSIRRRELWHASGCGLLLLAMQLSGPAELSAKEEARIGETILYNGNENLPVLRTGEVRFDRQQLQVKERARRMLRDSLDVPQRVSVPRDIPLHATIKGEIIFPRHRYERRYVEGWNACLYVVGNTKCDLRDGVWPRSFTSFKNDSFSGGGRGAGILDCRDRIRLLATIYDVTLIRETARQLHRELPSDIAWDRVDSSDGKTSNREKRLKALEEIPDLPTGKAASEKRN